MSKKTQATLLDLANIQDWKLIANRFILNSAMLWGLYASNVDNMIFSRGDNDMMIAGKLAGIMEGLFIVRPMIRGMLPFDMF